ncbi:FecR domain-containing protein [uncultured Xanthomonas sp.]|uniref:FecR family protein n=1 Tax=uncultured Xanthomonas sp. TaxID=152831 RepID=UPI0025D81640|nr:FecR domain-containing protein [uncultured Xanthomonas sp.]
MTAPHSPDDSLLDDSVFEQAVHWTLRLDTDADDATCRAHAAWLALAPALHAQAMVEARALLGVLHAPAAAIGDELGIDLAPPVSAAAVAPRAPASPLRRRRTRRPVYAAAATLALAIGGSAWVGGGGLDRLRSDAFTRVGEVRIVHLRDGSVVTLNTDSAIAVDMQAHLRSVQLLRGEALLQVTHDPRRPFVVDSAGGSARVLGTRFDVRLQGRTAEVAVIDGRVAVRAPDGGSTAVLRAGQRARLSGDRVHRLAPLDPLAVGAWQRRQLLFDATPLAQVLEELSRYRHDRVLVRDARLRAVPVSGSLDVADPERALRTLLDSLNLEALDLGVVTLVHRRTPEAATAAGAQSMNSR